MKLQDMNLTDKNTGYEFARHDQYRMKIDYITLECAFLNFKSFVCKACVNVQKTKLRLLIINIHVYRVAQ